MMDRRLEIHEAAKRLAAANDFSVVTDNANRTMILARGEGMGSHGSVIVAETPDHDTGVWLVACLKHGADGAAKELAEGKE